MAQRPDRAGSSCQRGAESIAATCRQPGDANSALRSARLGFLFVRFLGTVIEVATKAVVVHHFVRSAGAALALQFRRRAALPFCAWFVLDIAANFKADTLYEYDTWIPLLF